MTHLFGAHTSNNGGLHMAIRRAGAGRMRAMQLFTTLPMYYGDKASIKPDRVERAKAAFTETKIDPANVIAHAAYVLNTATHEEEKYARAKAGLAKELERSTALGLGVVCFHPGAALDDDREVAAERVAGAIVHALQTVPTSRTRVLVENTAGAGRTFAKTAAEVAAILRHVPKELRARTGYGLDTCHLLASGYEITANDGMTRALDEFEQATGEPPGFVHMNDSANPLGSNKDRHALIGEGHVGVEPFRALLKDRRSLGIPLVLETPQENEEIDGEDPSPDPYDVRMLALLESLVG
ncbi:MAG TPA: deoxyribonuclease IV [Gemmatimonadaceae bacterium]|jgi:deoxyribonuclease-4|nr:deoxyribonuclease IV [Gemmatimonadaceae bacterium]